MCSFPTKKSFLFIVAFAIVRPAALSSQSIAGLLSEYHKAFQTTINGISMPAVSDVTFHRGTGTLFVINDRADFIFEISTSGEVIREIRLSGFTDTEGIAWRSENWFYICDERKAEVVKVELPASGSGPVDRNSFNGLSVADNMGNTGLEGVAYHAATNTIYSVKEKTPVAFYRITCDDDGNPVAFFENDPFAIEGINGDAAGVYALEDGNFLILSQEDNRLYGFNREGEILSDLGMDMQQPEGVTFDPESNRIYVAGEPNQLAVFETEATATFRPPAFRVRHHMLDLQLSNANTATVDYCLPSADRVRIELVSLEGKKVRTLFAGSREAGSHRVVQHLRGIAAGVYGVLFRAGAYQACRIVVVE